MRSLRMLRRSWLAAVVVALLLAPVAGLPPASAADASLTVTALRVLEQAYVEQVDPVQLLNAGIATMRAATKLSADALPDIPPGTPEFEADSQFATDFSRAAQSLPAGAGGTQLAYVATAGMLASLHDSHTYYLPPQAFRETQRQVTGNPSFTGIGVEITSQKDSSGAQSIFVANVFPGSPAAQAGLKRFDRLVAVDGQSLANKTTSDVSRLIRGTAGSSVTLTVQRGGQSMQLSVTRAAIQVPPVQTSLIAPGLAYLQVYEFSQGAGRQLRAGIQALQAQGPIRSAVLDLRDNPGGLITEAASVGGAFLPAGTVLARIHERGQAPSLLQTSGEPVLPGTPLVVLVDGQSASASEILAGAFKDYGRATIVGDKTAGALGGSIMVALPEGGMSVTVESILTPKNERVEGAGITPDLNVSLTANDMERGQDTQLQAALHALGTAVTLPARSSLAAEQLVDRSRAAAWRTHVQGAPRRA